LARDAATKYEAGKVHERPGARPFEQRRKMKKGGLRSLMGLVYQRKQEKCLKSEKKGGGDPSNLVYKKLG